MVEGSWREGRVRRGGKGGSVRDGEGLEGKKDVVAASPVQSVE